MKAIARQVYARLPFKQPVFEVARRLVRMPEPVYRHLHFHGPFTTEIEGRSFQMLHHGYQVENELFWSGLQGGWERVSLTMWRQLCQQSAVIIDVGANTGIYSLVAKAFQPSAKVVAFEPVTRMYQKLLGNVELNGYDVICEELAVSNADGEATIYDLPTEAIYSVTLNENRNPPSVPTIEKRVRTVRLDSYMKQKGIATVDLIKIDVETHEPQVVEGMGTVLRDSRPSMVIEILRDDIGQKVERLVAGLDYRYYNIDEKNPPRLVKGISRSDHYNYLLCRPEVAGSLGLPTS
jgi:FkbM family methyltransferase